MNRREAAPATRLGQRILKTLIAGLFFVCTWVAWHVLRNPAWDGWWDAFNWPQLFLYAPSLFFQGALAWNLFCVIAEVYRKAKRKTKSFETEGSRNPHQATAKFWLTGFFAHFSALHHELCDWGNSDGSEVPCDGSKMAVPLVVVERSCLLPLLDDSSIFDSRNCPDFSCPQKCEEIAVWSGNGG
jgi:hypothetical protein